MHHIDLFSGIGGFALAAERVWPDIEHTFCEIDPFCQAILRKHWPTSKIYGDIRTLTNANNERCDLITGGFPCQPFSAAGKRKGTNDDRHLWPEMRRVIQEFSPRYVVAENVRGLLSIEGGMVFEQVCLDLEALGYEVQPLVIPACAVNAPHRRDRVWIVAHRTSERWINGADNRQGRSFLHNENGDAQKSEPQWSRRVSGSGSADGAVAHATSERSGGCAGQECGTEKRIMEQGESERGAVRCEGEGRASDHATNANARGIRRYERAGAEERATARGSTPWDENWPEVATRLCGVDDGLPSGVPRPRGWRNAALKAYGNAIVPQVAEQFLRTL